MSNNKLPDMMNKEQLTKLFESMYIPKLSIACFMALMCGLRVREVCNILTQDIDLQRRTLKIRDSKNPNRKKQGYGKDRIQPIPEIAISPIKKWLTIIEGGKYFLPSMNSPDKALRTKTLHEWFKEARERANLDMKEYEYTEKSTKRKKAVYKFRFHHLRHFYAQYVYDITRDLYAVANLLGHNQVTTTQIYAKVSDKTKKDTVDFAFNTPIKTQIFEKNPANALNYNIPEIAKEKAQNKSPIEILEDRFAKGEISAIDFQTAIRLLKVRKDYLNENEPNREIEYN
ncbi:tyrosine-type recombinase/integrase [archaeon]|nr:tyrosine-type recombinase/integrase [archaeon]